MVSNFIQEAASYPRGRLSPHYPTVQNKKRLGDRDRDPHSLPGDPNVRSRFVIIKINKSARLEYNVEFRPAETLATVAVVIDCFRCRYKQLNEILCCITQ